MKKRTNKINGNMGKCTQCALQMVNYSHTINRNRFGATETNRILYYLKMLFSQLGIFNIWSFSRSLSLSHTRTFTTIWTNSLLTNVRLTLISWKLLLQSICIECSLNVDWHEFWWDCPMLTKCSLAAVFMSKSSCNFHIRIRLLAFLISRLKSRVIIKWEFHRAVSMVLVLISVFSIKYPF